MKSITFDKLKVFQKYNGDEDLFFRIGREKEKQLFCNNEWHLIDNYLQSISMIKNGLVAEQLADSTLKNLVEISDESSFKMLPS